MLLFQLEKSFYEDRDNHWFDQLDEVLRGAVRINIAGVAKYLSY